MLENFHWINDCENIRENLCQLKIDSPLNTTLKLTNFGKGMHLKSYNFYLINVVKII